MKKTFVAPSIDELDFKDTATCGTSSMKVTSTSGGLCLTSSKKCFSLRTWMFDWGSFDDSEFVQTEEIND